MKKAAFISIGCKTNQYEAEAIREAVSEMGFEMTDLNGAADIYVINTCTVTAEAARKSKQMIRKARDTGALVCVMGCYSQLEPGEINAIDGVCYITGTGCRSGIISYLQGLYEGTAGPVLENEKNEYEEMKVSSFSERTRAYIKIEDGCDSYCSYCIVPYARGGVRSRAYGNIIEEAERLSRNGYSEVVVTGTNICKYSDNGKTIIDVLEGINEIKGICRIRLSSVYPDYLNEENTKLLMGIGKLCPHFHISLQSGSSSVLRNMRRKYTAEEAAENLCRLTAFKSDMLFSADVIVGFPGETDKDFRETYEFLSHFPFYHTHVFRYSPRKGTAAASMPDQVDPQTKAERSRMITAVSFKMKKRIIEGYKDRYMGCLFEQRKGSGKNLHIGRTDNYIEVVCGGNDLSGKILNVKINGYKNGYATGKVQKNGPVISHQ